MIVQTSIRMEEELRMKINIVATYHKTSMNKLVVAFIEDYVKEHYAVKGGLKPKI